MCIWIYFFVFLSNFYIIYDIISQRFEKSMLQTYFDCNLKELNSLFKNDFFFKKNGGLDEK